NPGIGPESVAGAEFQRDFLEKYPDLKPYGAIVDAVAQRLEASGYKGESREAVMEEYAKGAREELARQRGSQPMLENRQTPQNEIGALQSSAEKGDATAQNNLGVMYQNGRGVTQDVM